VIYLDTEADLDVIHIMAGGLSEATAATILKLSGNKVDPSPIYSNNNMAVLKFESDSSIEGQGFVLQWNAGMDDCKHNITALRTVRGLMFSNITALRTVRGLMFSNVTTLITVRGLMFSNFTDFPPYSVVR
jgi:hypothetical protein